MTLHGRQSATLHRSPPYNFPRTYPHQHILFIDLNTCHLFASTHWQNVGTSCTQGCALKRGHWLEWAPVAHKIVRTGSHASSPWDEQAFHGVGHPLRTGVHFFLMVAWTRCKVDAVISVPSASSFLDLEHSQTGVCKEGTVTSVTRVRSEVFARNQQGCSSVHDVWFRR